MKYKGKVKYNGNHYYAGDTVIGSQLKIEDGITYIFDDDEVYVKGLGDFTRYEWVEVTEVEEVNNERK